MRRLHGRLVCVFRIGSHHLSSECCWVGVNQQIDTCRYGGLCNLSQSCAAETVT